MATGKPITRRRFLGYSAIIAVPLGNVRHSVLQTAARPSPEAQLKQFATHLVRTALRDPGRAARLGTVYISDIPGESDLVSLLSALFREYPSLVKTADSPAGHDLTRTLHQIVKRDFEYGKVVNIRGWVVARTEARLAALASLV